MGGHGTVSRFVVFPQTTGFYVNNFPRVAVKRLEKLAWNITPLRKELLAVGRHSAQITTGLIAVTAFRVHAS